MQAREEFRTPPKQDPPYDARPSLSAAAGAPVTRNVGLAVTRFSGSTDQTRAQLLEPVRNLLHRGRTPRVSGNMVRSRNATAKQQAPDEP